MVTIKQIADITKIKSAPTSLQIEHNFEHEQVMGAFDGETLLAIGSLSLINYKVYLNYIESGGDFALIHGLAKALLNMADLRGIKTVYGNNPALFELYRLLRFKEENGEFSLSLEGYFTSEH